MEIKLSLSVPKIWAFWIVTCFVLENDRPLSMDDKLIASRLHLVRYNRSGVTRSLKGKVHDFQELIRVLQQTSPLYNFRVTDSCHVP